MKKGGFSSLFHWMRILWIGCLFLAVCQMPVTGKEKETKSPIRILCYGDSNTFGLDPEPTHFRYPKKDRWTTLLQKKLGSSYKVINEGLNGRTTAYDLMGDPLTNGLTFFPDICKEHLPLDYIVFMLGSNDCSVVSNAYDIQWGMELLIRSAQSLAPDATIVLVVPAAIETDLPPGQLSRQLAPLYQELADKYQCLYVDGTYQFEVSSIDGLHLSKEGHRQVAQALYDCLSEKKKVS